MAGSVVGSLGTMLAPARRVLLVAVVVLATALTTGLLGSSTSQPAQAADPVVACAAEADGALRLVDTATACTPDEAAVVLTDASAPVVVCALEPSGPLHAVAAVESCEAVGAKTILSLPQPTEDITLCAVTTTGVLHRPGPLGTSADAATPVADLASDLATCDPATETAVVIPATPAPEPTSTALPPTSTAVPATGTATAETTVAQPTATTGPITQAGSNRAPRAIARIATVAEDGSIRLTVTGTDPDGDRLVFSVARSPVKGSLGSFGSTSCSRSSSGVMTCRAAIRYTPNDNLVGSDYFRFTVRDDGGLTSTATVRLTITPINDAPSFTSRGDVTAHEDRSYSRVWAVDRTAGPADERGQALTFTITQTTNPSLFSTQPAISAVGRLTFVPVPDADGTATITVVLSDSGGTATGGDDTADPVTVTITVHPVNDEPSFTPGIATITVAEDSGPFSQTGWASAINPGSDPSESD